MLSIINRSFYYLMLYAFHHAISLAFYHAYSVLPIPYEYCNPFIVLSSLSFFISNMIHYSMNMPHHHVGENKNSQFCCLFLLERVLTNANCL